MITLVRCPDCNMEFDTQEEHDKHHKEVHEVNIPQDQKQGEQEGGLQDD